MQLYRKQKPLKYKDAEHKINKLIEILLDFEEGISPYDISKHIYLPMKEISEITKQRRDIFKWKKMNNSWFLTLRNREEYINGEEIFEGTETSGVSEFKKNQNSILFKETILKK